MIMCARFNLSRFISTSFHPEPLSSPAHPPQDIYGLLFIFFNHLVFLFFFIDFHERQRNRQATYVTSCCGCCQAH